MNRQLRQMLFFLFMGFALIAQGQNTKQEKRIYLVDVTASMVGEGSVETLSIFDVVKDDLTNTIESLNEPSTEIVIIPFTDAPLDVVKASIKDKKFLLDYIKDLSIKPGNTNITAAWSRGVEEVDSTRINYFFLLTDGLHNCGTSKDALYSELKQWGDLAKGKYYYAFYVVVDNDVRKQDLCNVASQTDQLWVVESMDVQEIAKYVHLDEFDEGEEFEEEELIDCIIDEDGNGHKISWRIILCIIVALILLALIYYLIRRFSGGETTKSGDTVVEDGNSGGNKKSVPDKKKKKEKKKEKVRILPWVGEKYSEGINGRRVMVMRSHHYCDSPDEMTPDITIKVISDHCDPHSEHKDYYKRIYTILERALAGKELNADERVTLWGSIIFYNYIQCPIKKGQKPTAQEYLDSEEAFFEVLEEYKPDIIIVCGQHLYDNLPQKGYQLPDITTATGEKRETWAYKTASGHDVCLLCIPDPSMGFAWDYWHEVINAFINRK